MLYSFNKIWHRGVALASVMGDKNLWPRSVRIESQAKLHSGLSVFFPAFNDALSLPSLLERTFETLRRIALDYEVIVVNDGSTDATARVLEELSQTYAPVLRVVTHPRNLGYGAALRSGFAAATKDYIFYTDGDSQYDPAELEKLLLRSSLRPLWLMATRLSVPTLGIEWPLDGSTIPLHGGCFAFACATLTAIFASSAEAPWI